jgi:RNA polymerase sigma factor (sigma-70 family)
MTTWTDQHILEAWRLPEQRDKAFRQLVVQYQRPIYYYTRRMLLDHDDADDVTQTTFILVWKSLDTFRSEARLSTWLHTIAYRECIHFLKKKKRLAGVDFGKVEHELSNRLQEDEWYNGDEIQRRLQVAVAQLPEKQKAVFIMKYFEEKKYEEIALITGTSVGALKASYHHAVQKIEAHLAQQNIV